MSDAPTMLSYATHVDKGSLFNTPNTLGVWMLERMLAWMEAQGLDQIEQRNRRKSGKLYDLLDSSSFWLPQADRDSRSMMNVTWRIHDPELEGLAIQKASEAGLSGLKGHRSVGGLRASLYNALPEESVDRLISFLMEFERKHG